MKTRISILIILLTVFTDSFAQDIPPPQTAIYTERSGANLYIGESSHVGKIEDNFEVNQNGLLNYEIPISVPPGTGGMTPLMSLNYTSTQGDGLLGSGFELGGLSVINRAPANLHVDGRAGYVNFTSGDNFMLDGQRLIMISRTSNSQWEYRTENNSFSQIMASGGVEGSPATFTVRTKSGLIYEYSSNTAPLTRAVTNAGDVSVFWLLTKVSDTKSNFYTISYGKDNTNGEYWPIRIDYTGNTTKEMVPYNSIRFAYTTNYTPHDAFVYGVKVRRSKIITGINIYSGSTRIKYYQMAYQTVNNNRQLTQVTEYASDGTKKNPTKFSWYNSNSYVTTNVRYDTTSQITKANVHVGDFNGDGKSDFLITPKSGANWSGWRLFLSNGNSFSYHSSGSFSLGGEVMEVVVGDFNGDGYSDFVLKRKYNNKYYNSDLYLAQVNGSSATFTFSKCFLSDTRDYSIKVGEFTGDGAADIFIGFYNSRECKMIRSEGYGPITPLSYTATCYGTINWDRVEMVDFDGNGLTDIMNLHADGYKILVCNGAGTGEERVSGAWPNKDHHLYFGDFNGDGKTDMLLTGWNKDPNSGGWSSWAMNFSKGDGTFERYDFTRLFNSKDKILYIADITGDGKDDFYAVDKSAGSGMSKPYAYINSGTGKSFSQVSAANTYGLDKWNYYLGDYNGDGKTDFLCTANFSNVVWTGYQLFLVPEATHNLLASVTDGLGAMLEVTYKLMSNSGIYTRGTTSYSYPISSFTGNWYLVDKVLTPNGVGGKNTVSHKYKNALMHMRGRGFVGFEYFTQKDETNNVETTIQLDVNSKEFISAIKSVDTKIAGKLLKKVEYTNTLKNKYNYNNHVFSFQPTYSKEINYEYTSGSLLSTTENNFEYDDYGNVTKLITTSGSNVITNTYTNDESKWFLGRLTKAVVNKKNASENITLTTNYEYDSTSGLLVREEYDPSDTALGYSKTYFHDDFGNITKSSTIPQDSAQPTNTVTTSYDASGRFIVKSTDNMGYSAVNTINYDLGVVILTKDPNNYETQFEYDIFGDLQVKKTLLKYEKSTYQWISGDSDAPSNAVYLKKTEIKGIAPVTEYYDILGRVIRTVAVGFNSQKIYVDVVYNTKGQVEKTSEPYFAGQTVYWNRNEYDIAGRISRQIYADNSAYTFQYNGYETTTTDPLGHKIVKKVDAYGNLIESTDAKGGKVIYTYDISNNCIRVVSPRTTITSIFDNTGNKKAQVDPDMGTSSYTYNCYGELLSKTVNGKDFAYEYDKMGRIRKETNPDGIITYAYDSHWKGSLDKVSSSNGTSEEYFYDSHGRLVKRAEVTDGKTFITETSYNTANNLPETTTYPSGLKVKNEYDATGYLNAVKNQATGYTYWTASKRNARGQLESIIYGNKLITSVTYNAQKGYITDISTSGIQNWSYAFNTVGNLTERRNNLRNLSEHFEYDELDRLVKVRQNGNMLSWTVTKLELDRQIKVSQNENKFSGIVIKNELDGLVNVNRNNALKQEMRYDAMGNLTYKTGVGSLFIYQNGTNRLVSVTGGGYNPKAWDEITYTAYNKVSYIRSGTDSQSILYGPSQQRKKTVTVVDGVTETKYYCGGLYEEVQKGSETKKISYIFADGESIAIFEQSTINGDKLLYLHKDHLGSVQALTNESGALVQELSYDAWGKRRNPINWEDYSSISAASSLTPWGFTGHEHMDMFDIINMDGRMYDPVLGRFLSPDPFAQAPDYTQGLNRYIYCLNNPLSLYDPTGYSWFSKAWKSLVATAVGIAVTIITAGSATGPYVALLAGAAGGAAAGLTSALLNGADIGQIAKSTFIGGFLGAVGGFLSFASGEGLFLERLFKHTFSQAWLEGIRGGNMKHGLLAGATSVIGGATVEKYGSQLGKGGEAAANAIISGTAAELGGGQFANGAITGAFEKLFNDFMHTDPPQKGNEVLVGQVEDGGWLATAAPVALALSAADGPLPIGEAVGAVVLGVAVAHDVATKIHLTYVLTNDLGQVYIGRTSGYGDPKAIMMKRFYSHGRKLEGFGHPVIDKVAKGPAGYFAIRGREQQYIDYLGGIGAPRVANTIRGVARFNPYGRAFHAAASLTFGSIADYTGF